MGTRGSPTVVEILHIDTPMGQIAILHTYNSIKTKDLNTPGKPHHAMNRTTKILQRISIRPLQSTHIPRRRRRTGTRTRRRRRSTRSRVGGSSNERSDVRARKHIWHTSVKHTRVVYPWITIAVCTRETDELVIVRFAGLSAADTELGTGWVEFCHVGFGCEVESDDFVSDEVVARCEIGGDGYIVYTTVVENLLEPERTSVLSAYLMDLEPPRLCRVELIARRRATRCHVGQHRTRIMRPITMIRAFPTKSHQITRIRICDLGSGQLIDPTGQRRIGSAVVWVLGVDFANDAWAVGAVWVVAGVDVPVDGEGGEETVCGYAGASGVEEE